MNIRGNLGSNSGLVGSAVTNNDTNDNNKLRPKWSKQRSISSSAPLSLISPSILTLAFTLLAGSLQLQCVESVPITLKYDTIQRMEGIPILGRGYSATTNSFQSSCLDVNGTVEDQLFNYDCKFFVSPVLVITIGIVWPIVLFY